ncbi:MAG: hypothetical protein JO000_11555 [Alphaproteobacteria bacterium]|nr:hypothetical protein [Alphaproteobacteria bacterium]
MSCKLARFAYLTAALFPLTLAANASADEVFKPTTAISLPNGQKIGAFDISYVDPVIGIYILGDRTNKAVDVIDTDTNTVSTQLTATPPFAGVAKSCPNNDTNLNDCSGPDGVVVVRHREVWAGDGDSTVKVIDLVSHETTHVISTGGVLRADELCWDPRDKLVMVANNADTPPFATIISTEDYTVKAKIKFDGTNGAPNSNNGAEQCQWSHRTGKFYISIPGIVGQPAGTGGVAVIDPKTKTVETTFVVPLTSCAAPAGMALGPDHQMLLGCGGAGGSNHPTAIIDERNGHVIRTLANQSGSDMVWFNPGDGHYFLARSSAVALTQLLGVVDSDGIRQDQSIPTTTSAGAPNVHSVAADPIMNQVYVPIPGGKSTLCSASGTPGASDVNGCIVVLTTPNDDRPERLADRDHGH